MDQVLRVIQIKDPFCFCLYIFSVHKATSLNYLIFSINFEFCGMVWGVEEMRKKRQSKSVHKQT